MKKTIVMAFALVAMVACKNQNSAAPETEEPTTEAVVEPIVENEEQPVALVLDNGKKWVANAETTEGVAILSQKINDFEVSENIDSYHTLNRELQSAFKDIFQKCTMTGEGHEQLHNFLIPIHEELLVLEGDDLEASKKSIAKLKEQLVVYPQFFE
ncbi:hypothetical protein [Myroides guanonis]|uniref:Lipoprotein n=1 Tax=Myroides guanonis TaxID=1150112 RepID=A0A1I3R4Z0_9FLAO|nr:hypothetical protein [Myroides guanonis]SFJ40417.1 hypothetical protein SAMN04487893_10722 [Myroides guanonis]